MTKGDTNENQSLKASEPPKFWTPDWTFEEAQAFIAKVAERFQNDPGRYQQFIAALVTFCRGVWYKSEAYSTGTTVPNNIATPTIHQVYKQVVEILKGEQDLLDECDKRIKPLTADPSTSDL